MTQTLNLAAREHGSRVLGEWIAGREGAAARAGLLALGENTVENGTLNISELANLLGASARSAAGVPVTKESAIRVSVVYAAVALVAGAIASLPLAIYERDDRTKVDHDYWFLLNERAADGWTSFAFWEYLISSKLFHGDGFGRLIRSSVRSSKIIGMEPLHPLSVDPFRHQGRVLYRVNPIDGSPAYTADSADILHLSSLGFDGLRSPSPITYAGREAIGAAIAAQDYASRFFAGGANIDYALKTASRLTKEQLTELKASLLARAQNGGRGPLILSGGLEPAQLSINSKDAEILATRMFSVEEISRILGVPPHMIGHTDKTTSWGSGIEQQGIGFVRYTLQRHLTQSAQELNYKLWPVRERFFVEHLVEALERADLKSRYEAYRIAMGRAGEMPWMDAQEVRRRENLPPNANLKTNPGKAGKDSDEKPPE
ncbi:phage portal protein [Paracidovorax cattleyae]|uniref:Phage portal protein, HK97 family n=1 Tax=Paracidovorax cattleyae TaxID=80868 RepID=A0A1H0RH94_9BURK|nr:phage portal protein [Paracidovorax cattleyae]SDP28907.1 phage portal protein, HK97 family [Paracidovorax cattleyae]